MKRTVLVLVLFYTACSSGPGPEGIAFISNEDSGTVSIIDLSTFEVLDSIYVGKRPRGIRISPDGTKLYVALSGSPKCPPWMSEEECLSQETDKSKDGIAEIDWAKKKILRILPGGSDPEQFDISSNGDRIYVSNEDVGKASVIDLNSGHKVKELLVGIEPEGVRISPDQKWVLVTNESTGDVSLIHTQTNDVVTHIPVGNRPRDICFHPYKNIAYVSNETSSSVSVLDLLLQEKLMDIQLPQWSLPMGIALDASQNRLYVATGRGKKVIVVDIRDNRITGQIEVGQRPWGIALTDDGRFLVTANGPSNDITVIDTKNLKILRKIKVGLTPWGVAILTAKSN